VSNVKKRGPSEGSGTTPTVKFNGEARLKFHEATKAGMTGFLPRHDPSGSIRVTIELMLEGLFRKKESQKKGCQQCEFHGHLHIGFYLGRSHVGSNDSNHKIIKASVDVHRGEHP